MTFKAIKKRVLTKPGYGLLLLGGILVFCIHIINQENDNYINKFKTGELTLECKMKNGLEVIDPDKIVGVDDESGYFYFTNGSAKNCIVEKN